MSQTSSGPPKMVDARRPPKLISLDIFRSRNWWKRWWWVFLVTYIVMTTLCFTLLILVVIPAMANSAQFTVESLKVSNVTDNGFDLEMKQKIGSFAVPMHTDAFVATVFDTNGSTLFNLRIPEFSGSVIHLKQTVEIVDTNAFVAYSASLLDEARVQQRMFGATSVKILGRTLHLKLNKTLSVGGMRDLHLDIKSVVKDSGHYRSSTSMTYMHSQVSLDFGLTDFTIQYHGSVLGSLGGSLIMEPGVSVFDAVGAPIVGTLDAETLAKLKTDVQAGSGIPVEVVGSANSHSVWANSTLSHFRRPATLLNEQLKASLEALGSGGLPVIKLLGL